MSDNFVWEKNLQTESKQNRSNLYNHEEKYQNIWWAKDETLRLLAWWAQLRRQCSPRRRAIPKQRSFETEIILSHEWPRSKLPGTHITWLSRTSLASIASMAPSKSNFVTSSLKRVTTLKDKKRIYQNSKAWKGEDFAKVGELMMANRSPSPLISDPVTCRTASVTNDERSSFSTMSGDAKPKDNETPESRININKK